MLSNQQIEAVWQNMLAAEMRSLYFGDLAAKSTSRKQWCTGSSILISSGAAAAFLSKLPAWVASAMALVVAGISAYSFARLDPVVPSLVKLHAAWHRIHDDYELLWNHTYSNEAESEWEEIRRREQAASELASEIPLRERQLNKWHNWVLKSHFPEKTSAA